MNILKRYDSKLLTFWRNYLIFIFIYSVYHIIRDILQDFLGIRNNFTEFLHYTADLQNTPEYMHWITLGKYGYLSTLVISIFLVIAIPIARRYKKANTLDYVIFSVLLFMEIIWMLNFIYR